MRSKLTLFFKLFFLLLFVSSCSTHKTPKNRVATLIHGRNLNLPPVYRVKLPYGWKEIPLSPHIDRSDTTQPIATFEIAEENGTIHIVIHNFPTETQVPVKLQAERWQRQFDLSHSLFISSLPQAFSGYVGLLFEGSGEVKGRPLKVMAWALNLGEEHYQMLSHHLTALNYESRAQVTIKASGPERLMKKHKKSISAFAKSFELVEPIPLRS